MTDSSDDRVEFDDGLAVALASLAGAPEPPPVVKTRLLAQIRAGTAAAAPATPAGFAFRFAAEDDWMPHPVPGIRMKVLALNPRSGYTTLLLDVQPGTHFPAHQHEGDEECFVISGSVLTLGRRLGPGDFIHADAGTHHAELWTDEGARVLLIVPPEAVT